MKALIFFCLFTFSVRAYDLEWLPEMSEAAEQLLTVYPSESSEYLFLGSSPSGLLALLETVDESRKFYPVPFSRALFLRVYGPGDDRVPIPSERKILWDSLRDFLPTPEEVSGKKIVLIDYIFSGDTVKYFLSFLKAYYPKSDVAVFGFLPHFKPTAPTLKARYETLVYLEKGHQLEYWDLKVDSPLDMAFEYSVFRDVAPVKSIYSTEHLPIYSSNPAYAYFRHAIQEKVEENPSLLKPLKKLMTPTTKMNCFNWALRIVQ